MYQAKFYDISNEVDKGSVDFEDIDKKVNDLVIKNKEINVGDILFSLGRAQKIMEHFKHLKTIKLNEYYGMYIVIKKNSKKEAKPLLIYRKSDNYYDDNPFPFWYLIRLKNNFIPSNVKYDDLYFDDRLEKFKDKQEEAQDERMEELYSMGLTIYPSIEAAEHIIKPPKLHVLEWDETEEDGTPEQRALVAGINKLFMYTDLNNKIRFNYGLHNYDIVVNKKHRDYGYRDGGKYIYKDNGLYNLVSHIDDVLHLPPWVDVDKTDCGYSYFKDRLIDDNKLIPFKTEDWKVGKSYVSVKEDLHPFTTPYKRIDISTELIRKKDDAKAILSFDVILSAPWLGGPSKDIKEKDLDKIKNSVIDETSKVVISQNDIKQAETKANSFLKKLFLEQKVIYPYCLGPCKFTIDSGYYNMQTYTNKLVVIPLKK